MRRSVLLFIPLLYALVLACGGGAASPTAAPAADAPTVVPVAPAALAAVGERALGAGVALTVTEVTRAEKMGDFLTAADGKEYVIVSVLLENPGTSAAPYNLLYFKLKDGEGFESSPGVGADQQLSSGDLPPGDKVRGNVPFEVTKGASGLVLTYKPLIIGENESIRIALD